MKNVIFAMVAVVAISGCSQTERGAAVGGLGGAAIGGLATGDAGGAIVGGVVGAGVGALIGNASEPGYCRYRGRNGRVYTDRC